MDIIGQATEQTGYVAMTNTSVECGRIVFWRLNGEVDYSTLYDAWKDAGLSTDHILTETSREVAFARAVKSCTSSTLLGRRVTIQGRKGWAFVNESDKNEDLEYRTVLKLYLEGGKTMRASDASSELAHKVYAAYEHNKKILDAKDISIWLSQTLMPLLSAVPLRDRGGFYFIPNDKIKLLEAIVGTIRGVSSHTIYSIPALRDEDAVEAILDGLSAEAEKEFESLAEDLESMESKPLGKRALKTRAASVANMSAKIAYYEKLLGKSMTTLQERAAEMDAAVSATLLSLED